MTTRPTSKPVEAKLNEPKLSEAKPVEAKPVDAKPSETKPAAAKPAAPEARLASVDAEMLAANLARAAEAGGRALAAYLKPREKDPFDATADGIAEMVRTLAVLVEYWTANPERAAEAQAALGKEFVALLAYVTQRLSGATSEPVIVPEPRDKRFADPEWTTNPFFDALKQAYLATARWARDLAARSDGLDAHTRHKAEFFVELLTNALSPSNFLLTNPELLKLTLASNADNLARGLSMLAEDIEAGGGKLRLRQSDNSNFELGRNLALTPGKVVFQNDLMQLIQYAPATGTVLRAPLLIVPPWINKYYILDLSPQKSFIKWCVEQGITVFLISWVNPGPDRAEKNFLDYMREGPMAAMDVIADITGERKIHTVGYCVGGTMLATTLALLAAQKRDIVLSATLFATQVDFTFAGDLKVFIDERQISAIEQRMSRQGFLDSGSMADTFNALRSNDLIWPYVINNYLRGRAPQAFDLLYWNSDATRMPAANHSFYLRKFYLENRLTRGQLVLDNTRLSLKKVSVPIYNLATREDHIAPLPSVYFGARFFGGPMRFVVSGSGHIAGVINPPAANKYQFWTGPRPGAGTPEQWLSHAEEHPGSWWPDWLAWLRGHDPEEVAAREPGTDRYPVIEDAPGTYVRARG